METPSTPKPDEKLRVASLSDFQDEKLKVVKGHDRPVLLVKDSGCIHAVDNRCPHMGFPLSKGTISDGILTCHWHHARFDAASGCAFDLFADDIPSYDVEIEGDEVFISKTPRQKPSLESRFQRLKQGLEQNISLIQYKSIIDLLKLGASHEDIIAFVCAWGSANHEKWSDGMTLLALTANLWPTLSRRNQILCLCKATRQVAANCNGQPARRSRQKLDTDSRSGNQLDRWLRKWSQMRHRDGVERTLMTLLHTRDQSLDHTLFGSLHDRVYSDTGHNVDMANKAIELGLILKEEAKDKLLPLIVPFFTQARGEEEKSSWRSPIDLVPILREGERQLDDIFAAQPSVNNEDGKAMRPILLGEDPQAIIDAILASLQNGIAPLSIAKEVAYLSALRLAQFPESNDIADWFLPAHTFNYANAVYRIIERHQSADTCRGLMHGALSVFQDRYLNIPSAHLPSPNEALIESYAENNDISRRLVDILDSKQRWSIYPTHIIAALRAGTSISSIIDHLASAVLREDFDFHKLQVIEDAASQAPLWEGQPEAEHILAGAARHTAAHCPTPRAQSKMIQIAQRLQKGESLYEEEASH